MCRKRRYVIVCLPVLLVGGTEIQTLSLVRVLISGGYRVTVCCYYEFDGDVVRWFEEAGAEVLLLCLIRSQHRSGILDLLLLTKTLLLLFRTTRPDIVHIQYLAPGLMPILAARLARVPIVFATVHIAGSIAYGWKAKVLVRLAAHFCTCFICVSRGVEQFWFRRGKMLDPNNVDKGRKHITVYNAVDTVSIGNAVSASDKQNVRTTLGIADRPVIGIVGRLTYQKGHGILIDAMKEVIKEFPDIVLMIIGEGPDRQMLKKEIIGLGMSKNIFLLGTQVYEKVIEFYSVMDIVVMPSLYEGFGLTAAEAMAAGLAVIGSDIIGLREVIEDGVTGVLVPAGDRMALAKALIDLLKNPDMAKRMGAKGCERVNRLFSMDRFNGSVLAIYKHFY